MSEYFFLQYRMFNRRLKDAGLNPAVGWLLLLLAYPAFSAAFFYKIPFPQYVYILIPIFFIFNLSNIERNDFLKTCFPSRTCTTIRMIENLTVSLPFAIFLLYRQFYLMSLVLPAFALSLAAVSAKIPSIAVIPTPFGKHPYEFASGFRKTFLLFPLSCGLTLIAILVDNFNLGMFTLMLNMGIICSFYLQEENEYCIWQHAMSPARFLFYKTKAAFVYSLMANSPAMLALSIFSPENIPAVLICFLLGFMYLTLSIMIKYDMFPEKSGISGSTVMALCLIFPPLLIAMIPYMSNRAVKELSRVLK
ncbi:MAG: hypothetical protein LBK58_00245 [Prevotellaceae bacterium]|jgi:hypothetical protein|nr:hypothetical protein [Prevotellaceae bacterium]